MFNFLKNKKKYIESPIENWMEDWLKNTFEWIVDNPWGTKALKTKKILTPLDFSNIKKDNIKTIAIEYLNIIATQMDLDELKIRFKFYEQPSLQLTSDVIGISITSNPLKDEMFSGLYEGIDKNGYHIITLNLTAVGHNMNNLISTIAHELSHIKIEYQIKLSKYNEQLTDLLTVIYGLGIFGSNSSFIFFKTINGWGYNKQGYLRPQDWAFALALYSFIQRDSQSTWISYLSGNIRPDFIKCKEYILNSTSYEKCFPLH